MHSNAHVIAPAATHPLRNKEVGHVPVMKLQRVVQRRSQLQREMQRWLQLRPIGSELQMMHMYIHTSLNAELQHAYRSATLNS